MKKNYLIEEYPLIVLPTLAKLIGLNEAIILQQVHYWINNRHAKLKKGKRWCYNSYSQWQEQFPFWSTQTIARAIKNLEEKKILISSNFNKLKMDKTKWYTIDYTSCQNEILILSKRYNGKHQNDMTNTRFTTDSLADKVSKDTYTFSDENEKINFNDDLKSRMINNREEPKQKPPEIKINKFTKKIINLWNKNKPLITVHGLNNKTAKTIERLLLELRKGIISKSWSLNEEHLKKNCITKKILKHKFSKEEIKQVVKILPLYHKEGYWPQNKQYIPRTLPDMIHNPRTGVSWFLAAYTNPPQKIRREIKDKYPKLTQIYLSEFPKKLSDEEKNSLVWKIKSFVAFWKDRLNEHKVNDRCKYKFGSPEIMLNSYLEWLKDDRRTTWYADKIAEQEGAINFIGSEKTLTEFVKDYEGDYGEDYLLGKIILPSEEELAEKRKKQKMEERWEREWEEEEMSRLI